MQILNLKLGGTAEKLFALSISKDIPRAFLRVYAEPSVHNQLPDACVRVTDYEHLALLIRASIYTRKNARLVPLFWSIEEEKSIYQAKNAFLVSIFWLKWYQKSNLLHIDTLSL